MRFYERKSLFIYDVLKKSNTNEAHTNEEYTATVDK